MLQGYDIVAFSYSDWYAVQSSPQHLMRVAAEQNRVLFVDVPRSFLRFFKRLDPLSSRVPVSRALEHVGDNMHVFHPAHRFLPVGRLPLYAAHKTLQLNGRMLAQMLHPILRELKFDNPILWNFSPLHGACLPHLPGRLTVHDICDDWSNYLHSPTARILVEDVDVALTKSADVAFVFSNYMLHRRAGLNDHTYVVLPAGDVKHYSQAALPETQVPAELSQFQRPIIGAICVVDPFRFDPGLLAYIGKTHPEWSVVVLGPVQPGVDLSPLKHVSNVHMMGNRPLEQMPSYLKGFDVAIIPYALNDATRGIYPMKTQEYLAAGKPVVAPPLPECLRLAPHVRFGESHTLFVKAIEEALATDSPEQAAERRALAAQNTWTHRFHERAAHVVRRMTELQQV